MFGGVVAAMLMPVTAAAHPFGEPQSVAISAVPDGVQVEWSAAPDDVTALAAYLGVVGGQHVVVFEDGEYDEEASSVPAGVRLAENATVLSAYLGERITVAAAAEPCVGVLEPVDDVTAEGVTITYDCGRSVAAVEISVAMLTDIHPSYRTMAEGPDGQRHAYAGDAEAITWTLPGGPGAVSGNDPTATTAATATSAGRSAAIQLGAVAGVVLVTVSAWWAIRRRGRRARM